MYFLPCVSCLGTGMYTWYRSKDASSLALPLRLSSCQRSSDQLSGWSLLFTPDKSVSSRVSRTAGCSSSKCSAFTSVVAARTEPPPTWGSMPPHNCQLVSFHLSGLPQLISSGEALLAALPQWDPSVRQAQLRLHHFPLATVQPRLGPEVQFQLAALLEFAQALPLRRCGQVLPRHRHAQQLHAQGKQISPSVFRALPLAQLLPTCPTAHLSVQPATLCPTSGLEATGGCSQMPRSIMASIFWWRCPPRLRRCWGIGSMNKTVSANGTQLRVDNDTETTSRKVSGN